MRKNTIKQIALGIALAGYAIPSVWATTITTNRVIKGRAPIIASVNDSTKRTIDFETLKKNNTAHTEGERLAAGDYIVLRYKLTDADGDLEGNATERNANTNRSIIVYYKTAGGQWISMNDLSTPEYIPQTTKDGQSVFKIRIPSQATGATAIGAVFVERTQFGDPRGNLWYRITDLYTDGVLDGGENGGNDGEIPGADPTPGGGSNGENGNGGTEVITPTAPVKPETPIQPGSDTAHIYAVTDGAVVTTTDYTTAEVSPEVGGTYQLVITNAEGDDITSSYNTFTWGVMGNNESAVSTAADVTILDAFTAVQAASTNTTYTVVTNEEVAAEVTDATLKEAKAGLQGFKLAVTYEYNQEQ